MSSIKEMQKDGTIKRADASRIEFKNIHVREAFNLRDISAPDFVEDLAALEAHMAGGGRVPDLEVVPRDQGGVWLVDGHRRHMAYKNLIAKGHPYQWIPIVPFVGNDLAQTARILTSQEGRKLKPLEVAEGYRRLAAMGLTPDDIARRIGKTRQHVDQMLILASADHAVHQMVAAGEVSATTAVDVARKHGSKAAGVLKEAKGKAGKGKVTAAAVKPWAPAAKHTVPLLVNTHAILKHIDPAILARAGSVATFDKVDEVIQVSVSMKSLFNLVQNIEVIEESRVAKEEKRREKAAKAAQAELT